MRPLLVLVRSASDSFAGRLSYRLAFSMLLGAIVGALASVVPALLSVALRGVIALPGAPPGRGLSALLELLLGSAPWWMGVLVAFAGTIAVVALTLWSSKTTSQLAGEVTAALRIAMLRRAVHASARALDDVGALVLNPRGGKPGAPAPGPQARGTEVIKLAITRDTALVAEFVIAVLVGLPQAIVALITLSYDLVATGAWLALAGGVLFFAVSRFGAQSAARRVSEEMRSLGKVDAAVFTQLGDTLGAVEDLRVLGAREQALAEFAQAARACAEAKARVARAVALSGQIKTTFTALSPLLIVLAMRFIDGEMPAGDIAKLLLLVPLLMNRLDGLDGLRTGLAEREPTIAAACKVLELPEYPSRAERPVELAPGDVKGAVLFDNVSFAPPGASKRVIDQLTLEVPAGSILGLCGDTGCGKSTLLRLLLRLDDPDQGRILLDGTDLRSIEPAVLPSIFGVLGQSSKLFERTIAHNLRLGLESEPTDEQLSAALRRVHLDDLAAADPSAGRSLSLQFRAQPPNLSGGEQRRVLLARLLVREARIFVLDEPEAGLPSALAEELLKSVGEIAAGRTCLVVTHAPQVLGSTFNVVLEAGRVVGKGTHQELASNSEAYRALLSKALKSAENQRPLSGVRA